jgi:hypothetical protein
MNTSSAGCAPPPPEVVGRDAALISTGADAPAVGDPSSVPPSPTVRGRTPAGWNRAMHAYNAPAAYAIAVTTAASRYARLSENVS